MARVDRYYVVELEGWSLSGTGVTSSFSILDRYNAHNEVAIDYAGNNAGQGGTRTIPARRHAIAELCADLNSRDRAA